MYPLPGFLKRVEKMLPVGLPAGWRSGPCTCMNTPVTVFVERNCRAGMQGERRCRQSLHSTVQKTEACGATLGLQCSADPWKLGLKFHVYAITKVSSKVSSQRCSSKVGDQDRISVSKLSQWGLTWLTRIRTEMNETGRNKDTLKRLSHELLWH